MGEAFVRLLGRTTSGHRLIPEIDGLRFFAIASVILFHANIQACRLLNPGISDADMAQELGARLPTSILARGEVGVPVFFALSGFILGMPFAKFRRGLGSGVNLRSYFERRISRLEVPFLVALLAALVAVIASRAEVGIGHLIASATYLHQLIYGTRSTINPVSWSLEIEVQFYCLAPLLAIAFAARSSVARMLAIASMMVPSIVMYVFFDEQLANQHLNQTILGYAFYFLTGFMALELFLSGAFDSPRGKGWTYDVIGVAAVVALLWPGEISRLSRTLMFPPACIALFASAFRGRAFNAFFTSPAVVVTGGMCYSIYLLHYGIMILAARVLGPSLLAVVGPANVAWATTLLFVTIVPISILPCVLFFVAVEKPCMRRGWHVEALDACRNAVSTLEVGFRRAIAAYAPERPVTPISAVPVTNSGQWDLSLERRVFRMHWVEQRDFESIAAACGITVFQARFAAMRATINTQAALRAM